MLTFSLEALVFLCASLPQTAIGSTDADRFLSNAEAREEASLVVTSILRHHPDPFHVTPRNAFYSEVDRVLGREGDISVAQQYFDLGRIASLVFDTHTQFHVTEETPGFDSTFPLRFKIFPEGLYIIAGDEHYRDTIGKRVVSISGQDPDDVLDKLARHSASDNLPRKRVFAEIFLYRPETYDVFDLRTPEGRIELELQGSEGERSRVELFKTWEKGPDDFSWDGLNPFLPKELLSVHDVMGTEVPFYQRNIDDNYWYQFLDGEKKHLYVQINQQSEEEDEPVAGFHLEWLSALWESEAEVLIIDLRNDPGGWISLGSPVPKLLRLYSNHPTLQGIAVLFGLDTVSAGPVLVAQLEKDVWPILIGEPTGSSPNMYLNAEKLILPYSKLEFEVSTSVYVSANGDDTRAYIAPDIPMALSFEDYANGRDPLLEVAKTVNAELRTKLYEGATYSTSWKRASQAKAIR